MAKNMDNIPKWEDIENTLFTLDTHPIIFMVKYYVQSCNKYILCNRFADWLLLQKFKK